MPESDLKFNLDTDPESKWLTVTASQTARVDLLYVQELGDFLCRSKYYTYRSGLASYQIIYSASGRGSLSYRGIEYDVPAGSLIFLDCMEPQYYFTAPGIDTWHTIWVHFYGANASAYHRIFDSLNQGSPIISLGSDGAIRSCLDMLLRLYQHPGTTIREDIRASALLTQLLARCIQCIGTNISGGSMPSYVVDARNYIDLHYPEKLTLDSLANAISINKFYLQKLFKRCMGISPTEYIIYVRLNHAKELLRKTSSPISRVAVDVGITNIGHFVNLFKRYEGITPAFYRRTWYNPEFPENDQN